MKIKLSRLAHTLKSIALALGDYNKRNLERY